jgi:hypothetical protein
MDDFKADKSSPSIQTETMAQLLLSQKHWREAIDIYQKLGQQYPEKDSDYQKKIIEIRKYFKPQLSPESARKMWQIKQQIKYLQRLLKTVQKQPAAK